MPRLLDHFSPVVSEVLNLSVAMSADGHLDGAAHIRRRLVAAIETAQASARSEVRADKDTMLASFAVVAWIDEAMLAYPEWGTAAPNLQGELLGTQVARETFFTHLEQLGDGQDDVREVYYLLLCLGFEGYYGELSGGRQELERLKDVHGRLLERVPASVAALVEERLVAQPYGVKPPPPLPEPKIARPLPPPPPSKETKPRRWGLILSLILIPLALLLVLAFLLLPFWLRQEVDTRLAGLECAKLEGSVGFDRMAMLNGFVSSDADRRNLLASLDQTSFLAGVKGEVAVHPWPFCILLENAWPRAQLSKERGSGARIGLADPSQPLRHRFSVVVEAIAPDFNGYLYVFYVQSDGGVVPLLPNEMLEANQHQAGARVALGEESSPFRLQVMPPFGTDMLLLYAASKPLLSGPPKSYHNDPKQLADDLRAGLEAVEQVGGQTAASFSFIETLP